VAASSARILGLVDGDPPSRYGEAVSVGLDRDIDELARRLAALEAQRSRHRGADGH